MPKKKGAKRAKGASSAKLLPALEKRLTAEKKREGKLTALKRAEAKKLHEAQRHVHELTVERAKYSEARDSRVKSKAKLKERKEKRAELDREIKKRLRPAKELAKALAATDKKLENARAAIASITSKPIRDRRIGGIRFRKSDKNVFFVGGRRDEDVEQGSDYAFRVADMMRSRRVQTDRTYDTPKRHRTGKKKGQLQYKGWSGGLLERNTKIFADVAGKEIDLLVKGEVFIDGKLHRYRRTTRIRPLAYDDIIKAMTNTVRGLFKEYGSNVTYTISEVSFTPVTGKTRRPVKKKSAGGDRTGTRRVRSVKHSRKASKRSGKNVGRRRGSK
jgi:hypothetical protein